MKETRLAHIHPDKIVRNPDNPRIIFRAEDLEILLNSIKKVGIRVPLSMYQKEHKDEYVLMDGERRWLCAKKLNLSSVPAVIEPEPTKLENILRMFNIHNVRVQWDLLAIALKLQEVEKLLKKEKQQNSLKDIAAVTGVTLVTVKRAFDLLTLPEKYLTLLRNELSKPKSEQTFTEDFFLEMMKSLNAIERHTPEILEKYSKEKIMEAFIDKYKSGVITNIVKFRDISKIARSENAGISKEKAIPIIEKIIKDPKQKIEDAFEKSVADAYEERSLKRDIEVLADKLGSIGNKVRKDKEILSNLRKLYEIIGRIIK